jgi:hypothetical protein
LRRGDRLGAVQGGLNLLRTPEGKKARVVPIKTFAAVRPWLNFEPIVTKDLAGARKKFVLHRRLVADTADDAQNHQHGNDIGNQSIHDVYP